MKTHDLSPVNPTESMGIGGRAAVAQASIRLAGKRSRFRLAELLDGVVGFRTSLALL